MPTTELPFTIDRAGSTTFTEQIIRAHRPDGTTETVATPIEDFDPGQAYTGDGMLAAFGRLRWSFPDGTRFEQLQRTVQVIVTDWRTLAQAPGPTPVTPT